MYPSYKLHILLVHDLSGFAIHAHDPYLERRWRARLSHQAISDRAYAPIASQRDRPLMSVSINGLNVTIPSDMTAELAAARELLRQRALAVSILNTGDDEATIGQGIEELLAREVVVPTPLEDECRRYYEAHPSEFQSGDLVHVRHILFQVTASVRVPEIRARAERILHELLLNPQKFGTLAAELSNCPSGQQGGSLGQITRHDTVPEFEQALFRSGPTGILRELIKTRYGFHIVAIDQRIHGAALPFDMMHDRIAEYLTSLVEEKALKQYIRLLAGRADIKGVDLEGTESPLLQ